ncbi:hypothetical protein SEUCBS140593_002265 [Sporothrix eucalyptigena]|uniref:NWD NACHT-NTPase N-terminal domain-containing protein n=1 Tax=Sporothrix eucalyptigena TaxID=1812306 RepID=A0ABP0B590_9PEZI
MAPRPVADSVQPLSISQRLWNDAYDCLKKDEDTAKLVGAYEITLIKVVRAEASASGAADDSTELDDPETRQRYMKMLVKEGQTRISKVSKITKGIGEFADLVLNSKGIVDLVVQNFPQAALPWAGVCAGLQILMNPGNATKSNLAGIAHVVSRMDWYCALTEHLLDRDKIKIGDESFESVLQQLEGTVLTLYKALLLYQMKSVCSYHRNLGLAFLRGLANIDDWDGDLSGVTDAEATIERLSGQYHREYEKSSLYQLVVQGKEAQILLGDIRKDLREYIAQQQMIQDKSDNRECLRALFAVDPQSDMGTIESKKDDLLDDVYKWILDSKDRPEVELGNSDTVGSLVELDAQKLKGPVNAYIDHKVFTLRALPGYDKDTLAEVTDEIHRRSENTFLWAALVLKELHSVEGWYAVETIRTMPLGLSDLYEHMMTRIKRGKLRDPHYCKSVLVVASLAYRPLSLPELAVLADLPPRATPTIVGKCGSFLTVKDNTVYLIHQSAKDYLSYNFDQVSPFNLKDAHRAIFSRSLETMSETLRRDIYGLGAPGFPIEKVQQPAPDPLAVARYSCVYWVDHLCESSPSEDESCYNDLQEGGAVDSFLRKKYIYWLEALSLLRSMSEGVLAIEKLKNLLVSI